MKIRIAERGPEGEDGEHYVYETEIDTADEDEAYVKGREFAKMIWALARGMRDQNNEQFAERDYE